jgi:hypothetical protein
MQVRAQSVVIGTTFTKKENMNDQEKIPYNIELTFKTEYSEYDVDSGSFVEDVKVYENIIGYQVGNDVIAVVTHDGETHIYPMGDVRFVRHYPAQ